jgi:hypothetical protein
VGFLCFAAGIGANEIGRTSGRQLFKLYNEMITKYSPMVGVDSQKSEEIAVAIISKKIHFQATLISMKEISFIIALAAIAGALFVWIFKRFEMHEVANKNKYNLEEPDVQ